MIGAGIMFMLTSRLPAVAPIPTSASEAFASATSSALLNTEVFENSKKDYIINFKPLKESLTSITKQFPQKTFVYFAYLNNASWIGINERDQFIAASTVKVPLAMSIYRLAETGKFKMSDSYTLTQLDLDPAFGKLYQVGPDNSFTLEELMGIMLQHSDNTAMQALVSVAHQVGVGDPFGDVYTYMGWDTSNPDNIADLGTIPTYKMMDLKTLSKMFLSLYNADYDNAAHSAQILQYLATSEFHDQIVAGVPSTIPVSHKIGVWNMKPEQVYSDCGIVYVPNRNYILCLATDGLDKTTSNAFMTAISKAAYEYVSSQE